MLGLHLKYHNNGSFFDIPPINFFEQYLDEPPVKLNMRGFGMIQV